MEQLKKTGATIEVNPELNSLTISRVKEIEPIEFNTSPHPGFPTDMQAQLMTLLTCAKGTSIISETIFENRFMHVAELERLGAKIRVESNKALVHGVKSLSGATVMATDLRASACLVLAGLIASGSTTIRRIYHLDRGYEHIEKKLCTVGAKIKRFRE